MKNVSIQFDFKANKTEFFSSILKLFGTFLFCSMIYRRRNGTFLYVPGFLKAKWNCPFIPQVFKRRNRTFCSLKKNLKTKQIFIFCSNSFENGTKTFWFDPEFGFENVSIQFFPGRKQENESFRSLKNVDLTLLLAGNPYLRFSGLCQEP